MRKYKLMLLMALAVAVTAVFFGCADEGDDVPSAESVESTVSEQSNEPVESASSELPLPTISEAESSDELVFDPNGNGECELTEFTVEKSLNGTMVSDAKSEIDGEKLKIEYLFLENHSYIPAFVFTGRYVVYDGEVLSSGVTPIRLEHGAVLTVYAENGDKKEYTLTLTETNNRLPIVMIKSPTEIYDLEKEIYQNAEATVLGLDSDEYDIAFSTAQVRLRGNSTSSREKKPIRLKFTDKQNVLGMGAARDWALVSLWFDRSLIRNNVALSFAAKLDGLEYTPELRLCELYYNGEYYGVYVISEQIEVNSQRVDIDKPKNDEVDTGYLIEIDSRAKNHGYVYGKEYFKFTDEKFCADGQWIDVYAVIKNPDPCTDAQFDCISSYVREAYDLLKKGDERVWDYIDMDSFIDWYIVNELFKNADSAMVSSCYMYKEASGKLYMGPAWDFDLGGGNAGYDGGENPEGWWTRTSEWYTLLFGYSSFDKAFKDRWNEIRDNAVAELFTDIDKFYEEVWYAATANFAVWDVMGKKDWHLHEETLEAVTHEAQVEWFRRFLTERVAWFDSQTR